MNISLYTVCLMPQSQMWGRKGIELLDYAKPVGSAFLENLEMLIFTWAETLISDNNVKYMAMR